MDMNQPTVSVLSPITPFFDGLKAKLKIQAEKYFSVSSFHQGVDISSLSLILGPAMIVIVRYSQMLIEYNEVVKIKGWYKEIDFLVLIADRDSILIYGRFKMALHKFDHKLRTLFFGNI